MPVQFTGWKVFSEKQKTLKAGQRPQRSQVYTMYHGTTRNSAKAIITGGFRCSSGGTLGPGVYCSRDIAKAKGYPAFCSSQDQVVLLLRVKVGRVKKMDLQNRALWTTWQQSGYNTAWLPPGITAHEEDCVADPKRLAVIGIAHCSDAATKANLETLIKQRGGSGGNDHGGQASGGDGGQKCKGCGIQTQVKHPLQTCWACNANICSFMDKHVCKKR